MERSSFRSSSSHSLKRYIPGYSDQETKLNAYRSTIEADSLKWWCMPKTFT